MTVEVFTPWQAPLQIASVSESVIKKFEILEISIVKVQNVSDIEVAKRMSQDDQNFIELEDAPLKRKLTNPMPPGSYYTKPKKSNEMIAAGGGHASSTFSQVNLEICLLSLVAPLNIRAIWLNWPEW